VRLVSQTLTGATGANLDVLPFWKACLSVGEVEQVPCLTLALLVPSAIHLLYHRIPFAAGVEEVKRVAEVACVSGVQETDDSRLVEAFTLWRNARRPPSADMLAAATAGGQALLRAYWAVREWLADPKDTLVLQHEGQTLRGIP